MSALGKVSEAAGTQPAASGTATGAAAAATQTPAKVTGVIARTLFNETTKIFYGLIGSHAAQKGIYTCLFYAMDRILTAEQMASAHGKLCLQRKAAVEACKENEGLKEHFESAQKANELFLKSQGLDPANEIKQFWHKAMKAMSQEIPKDVLTAAFVANMCLQADVTIKQIKPWYLSERLEGVCANKMWQGHGLKEVVFKEMSTIQGLINALRSKGPLLIQGRYGQDFYKEPAFAMTIQMDNHLFYGWKKGAQKPIQGESFVHAIVIVGAEISATQTLVFWVDPVEPSDPKKQKVFVTSFKTILDNMATFYGMPLNHPHLLIKDDLPVAVYNPQFKAEAASIKATTKK